MRLDDLRNLRAEDIAAVLLPGNGATVVVAEAADDLEEADDTAPPAATGEQGDDGP